MKLVRILLTVLMLAWGWATYPATGFVSTKFLAASLIQFSGSPDDTQIVTHPDMTRNAILNVTADLLMDNPNLDSEGSSQRISNLSSLDEGSLITAYYGQEQRSMTSDFESAIESINDANSGVDFGPEQRLAAAHFDSEQFQSGQNRLIELRQNIVSRIMEGNFGFARNETGRMFHTLQDFYSHSNWIENGNQFPNRVLGKPNERIDNVADITRQTCTNCSEIGNTSLIVQMVMGFDRSLRESDFTQMIYRCENNIDSSLRTEGILTSGYSDGLMDIDGQIIPKPSGKCSHGGFLDTTSDLDATGGINKDSPISVWSPRSDNYEEAASVAEQATIDMLQEIRSDVNNDQLFGEYLGLTLNQEVPLTTDINSTLNQETPLTTGINSSLQVGCHLSASLAAVFVVVFFTFVHIGL